MSQGDHVNDPLVESHGSMASIQRGQGCRGMCEVLFLALIAGIHNFGTSTTDLCTFHETTCKHLHSTLLSIVQHRTGVATEAIDHDLKSSTSSPILS